MANFSASTTAEALVPVDRERVWEALVDPALVARMTPFVKQIRPDGDYWHWTMSGVDVLGLKVAPSFTERMDFEEHKRIEFHHQPPSGATERAGVNGWYDLAEADDGTALATSLEICLNLPLPRISAPAVRTAMKGVMATMGDRFSKNLLAHLGVPR